MKNSSYLLAGLLFFICSVPAMAHTENQDTTTQVHHESTRYGVGFQSTWPAWGISGMIDLNETLSAQAILGFFGNFNTVSGRGLYRFRQEDYWDLYGYGMIGYWRYNTRFITAENRLGVGAGAGIQYDWRTFDPNLPPIFWNLELGVSFVNFDAYNFNMITFGTGVHYRF